MTPRAITRLPVGRTVAAGVAVCLVATFGGPGRADEPEPRAAEAPRLAIPLILHEPRPLALSPFGARPDGYSLKLMKYSGRYLESLSAFEAGTVPGENWFDHAGFDLVSAQTQRGVERATRRAAIEYLLDVTDLDALIESKRQAANEATPGGARLGYRLSFYRGLPKIQFHRGIARGVLRFGLNPYSGVDLSWGQGNLRLGLGSDGDAHRLDCRFDF